MNEENKRKILIGSIVAVVTLIAIVVGATYAFYTLNVTDSETNTNINIETGSANVVSIEQGADNIHINLSVLDMASNSQNKEYYATDKTNENYKTDKTEGTLELAKVTMSSKGKETENCTATMTITMETKEDSMGRELKKGDSELYIEVGETKETIDLSDLLTESLQDEVTKDIELELSVTSEVPTSIKGYLKINNTEKDQTYLAGKTLNLTIEVKDLKCGVVKTAADVILASDQLEPEENVTSRGDTLRRYQGQVENDGQGNITNDVNNYICFETNDTETCTKNTDKYLYRIIGIDTTNKEIKVMKREALNTYQTWTSGSQTWANSTLQQALNSTLYLNTLDSSWSDLIIAHDWGYGDVPNGSTGFDASTTSTQAYQKEQTAIKSGSNHGTLTNTKIGLIYASDYYLSGGDSLKCYFNSSTYAECKKSWMHLSNNDTSSLSTSKAAPPSDFEWTIPRSDSGYAWYVNGDGGVDYVSFSGAYSVRPVFYLSSEIKIIKGDGSRENPYIIKDPNLLTAEEKILLSPQLEDEQQMKDRGDTLRRFQGQVTTSGANITNDVNNYICFGTNNEGTCTGDTDKYMYRIIGIDATNKEIKVMKREALNTYQTWTSSSQNWGSSTLQQALNSTLYLNTLDSSWSALIQAHDWGYGDVPDDSSGAGSYDANNNIEGQQMYKNEKAKITSGSNHGTLNGTKIGLIYVSDYYLSASNIKCFNSSTYGDCKKSWMHLSNNDTSSLSTTHADPPNISEWTMSRFTGSSAWTASSNGSVSAYGLSDTISVRPVFYLSSELDISGAGTLEEPFIINGVE